MTKQALTTPPRPPRGPATPERLVEFLADKLPRSTMVTLAQRTHAAHQIVDSWTVNGKERPEALAASVWQRAIEDAGTQPSLQYVVLMTPKAGEGEGARLPFSVPVPRESSGPLGAFPADGTGAIAQTMKHLEIREAASHAMLIEGLDGIVGGSKAERDEHQRTRVGDRESYQAVIDAYKILLQEQAASFRIQLDAAQTTIKQLSEAHNAQTIKTLELIPTIEELHSQKHEREMALIKQQRADDRKDRIANQAAGLVFPFLAKTIAPALGPGPAPAPTPAAPPSNAPPAPPEPPPTRFGPRTLQAIEAFLGALTGPELDGIRAALRPDTALLFDQIPACLHADMQAAERAAAAATNGAGARTEVPS